MSETYRIKPLVWECASKEGDAEECWTTHTVFGRISVHHESGCRAYWRHVFEEYYDEGDHECDSVDAGKKEAEAFYRQSLLSALEEV